MEDRGEKIIPLFHSGEDKMEDQVLLQNNIRTKHQYMMIHTHPRMNLF